MHKLRDAYTIDESEMRTVRDALRVAAPHLREDAKALAAAGASPAADRTYTSLARLADEFEARAKAIESLLDELS